jgi:hypothetical protein
VKHWENSDELELIKEEQGELAMTWSLSEENLNFLV